MTFKLLAGAALLGALIAPSIAFGATVTSNVNVRNAPVNGAVVDVLRAGQEVDIDRCQSNGWCYIIKPGPDGWVSSSFLSNDDDRGGRDDDRGGRGDDRGGRGDDRGDRGDDRGGRGDDRGGRGDDRGGRGDVDVDVGFSVPGFSFQIGNGGFDRPNRPGRPGGRDQVCFYERSEFRGDSFCARPGENIARLGRWDDEIGSIRVRGDVQALVCERSNFRGRCIVISRDARNLRGAEDEISSIRVR